MLHADNAYFLPAVEIRARVCRTNLPTNTAFRGFGGPQGMAVIETVMQEIAVRLGATRSTCGAPTFTSPTLRWGRLRGAADFATAPPRAGARSLTPYGQEVRDTVFPSSSIGWSGAPRTGTGWRRSPTGTPRVPRTCAASP